MSIIQHFFILIKFCDWLWIPIQLFFTAKFAHVLVAIRFWLSLCAVCTRPYSNIPHNIILPLHRDLRGISPGIQHGVIRMWVAHLPLGGVRIARTHFPNLHIIMRRRLLGQMMAVT
jgi:hypothetical protein